MKTLTVPYKHMVRVTSASDCVASGDTKPDATPTKKLFIFDRQFLCCDTVDEKRVVAFLSLVDFDDKPGATKCWIWRGSHNKHGYGIFRVSKKAGNDPAHRVSWGFFRGPIPEGIHLHHTCERHDCVNPKHLLPVTPREHVLKYTPSSRTTIHAAQTHCSNGHPLSGDNLYVSPGGHRRCRICRLAWERRKSEMHKVVRTPRTHCMSGHEFTPESTYLLNGIRFCRTCHAARMAEYQERLNAMPKLSKAARGIPERGERVNMCKKGLHEISGDNVMILGNGLTRCCKACYIERYRAENERRRKLAEAEGHARRGVHCRRGHDLTHPANFYIAPNGVRHCRACRKLCKAIHNAKKTGMGIVKPAVA